MARDVTHQALKLKPCGVIAGGKINYTYHAATGELYYQGYVLLWRYVWRKRYPLTGKVQLNPYAMLSENVRVGAVYHLKNLTVRVDSVEGAQAYCTLEYAGAYPGRGMASVNLNSVVVMLEWMHAEGRFNGHTIFRKEMVYLDVETSE